MTRPIDIVIPDAGPIISLAHADRLDLLEVFDRPVIVLDVVRLECLRKPQSTDHERLSSWFERAGNRISVAQTPLGQLYLDAVEKERSGQDRNASRGLGDAALSWALRNIDRLTHPDAIPLVLVEDRRLAVSLEGMNKGHILSTRSWLVALAETGDIEDYQAIIDEMARNGRLLSTLAVDAPVRTEDGRSAWLDTLKGDRSED